MTRYKGAIDVIRFNLSVYLTSLLIFALGSVTLTFSFLNSSLRILLYCILGIQLFWFISSVLASHWIYDRSPLSQWTWLRETISRPEKWLSIHSGFDQTRNVRELFHDDQGIAVDIFDAGVMTEPSILRARKITRTSTPAIQANLRYLPFRDHSMDSAFLIFSLHEVRDKDARIRLFMEIKRIVKPGSLIMILEHGRDLANFLAFGPGCFHFLPNKLWFQLAAKAGFQFHSRRSFTPFVNALFFQSLF